MNRWRDRAARQAPAGAEEEAATRHLCAGVYLDPAFRWLVLRRVHNSPSRRVAPSYGFDLVAVVAHAWRAWAMQTAQQLLLVGAASAATAADGRAVLIASCTLGECYLAGRALPVTPELVALKARALKAQWLRQAGSFADSTRLKELSRLVGSCFAGSVVLLVIAVAAAAGGPGHRQWAAAGMFLVLAAAVAAAAGAARQAALNRLYRDGGLRPARLWPRLRVIGDQQDGDYVVYRRSEPDQPATETAITDEGPRPVPFIGAGLLVHRWLPPLGVQLLRPGDGPMQVTEHAKAPFQAHELVQHLKTAMGPVGLSADPDRLRGFQARDRLFIAEEDVPPDREFLQGPRKPQEIEEVIDNPHGLAQHYLEMQVSATGELVTTLFLRVTVRGKALSLDFSACALTRTPHGYHIPDKYRERGAGAVARSALRAVWQLPATATELWQLATIPWLLAAATQAGKDRTLVPRRGKDIGAPLSVREEASCPWEKADKDKVTIYDEMKIIERRLLKATQDFLEEREVDTSIFKRQVMNIINSGVLNMGKLEIQQAAVGTGAQIHNHGGPGGSPDGQQQTPEGNGT